MQSVYLIADLGLLIVQLITFGFLFFSASLVIWMVSMFFRGRR